MRNTLLLTRLFPSSTADFVYTSNKPGYCTDGIRRYIEAGYGSIPRIDEDQQCIASARACRRDSRVTSS